MNLSFQIVMEKLILVGIIEINTMLNKQKYMNIHQVEQYQML